MSEMAAGGTPPSAAEPEAPAQVTDWEAEAARLREELVKSRKWEDRAKENSKAAAKLAEIEAASMTEAQRLTARAEAAEKALAERESEALRLRIASKHGITGDYLDLLSGADEAALESAAVKLASLITKEPERKGALGPYIPGEGSAPGGALGTPADVFGAFIHDQLGR